VWVYYYVSKDRVAQIAGQLCDEVPSEEIKRWDLEGEAGGHAGVETAALLSLIAKGRAEISGKASATRSHEKRFTHADKALVNQVREALMGKNCFVELSSDFDSGDPLRAERLLRFRGNFAPVVRGNTPAERLAEYHANEYLAWTGKCGMTSANFVTSSASMVSPSPLYPVLTGEVPAMWLDGFATFFAAAEDRSIWMLPLFFGLEISE
jgi:hypothetical protein